MNECDECGIVHSIPLSIGMMQIGMDDGTASLIRPLSFEPCPACGSNECVLNCVDSRTAFINGEDEIRHWFRKRLTINVIDGIALEHAKAGIDVGASKYVNGLQAFVDQAMVT